jgi:hypothetical protein
MTTNGEKMTLLAEIIRVSTKGATKAEISDELSLSSAQVESYLHFLRARRFIVLLDRRDYFPSERGLAYLSLYDCASDLVDVDSPQRSCPNPEGARGDLHWSKEEVASRMKDIIER